jgi:hypothetical protein
MRAQRLTGAKVDVLRGDDEVIASGGEGQYLYSDSRWTPCKVDAGDIAVADFPGVMGVDRMDGRTARSVAKWLFSQRVRRPWSLTRRGGFQGEFCADHDIGYPG